MEGFNIGYWIPSSNKLSSVPKMIPTKGKGTSELGQIRSQASLLQYLLSTGNSNILFPGVHEFGPHYLIKTRSTSFKVDIPHLNCYLNNNYIKTHRPSSLLNLKTMAKSKP